MSHLKNYVFVYVFVHVFFHFFIVTVDKNSAISIMKLTECWINTQTRPVEFQIQASSFTCGNKKAGLSKTIGVKETIPNG